MTRTSTEPINDGQMTLVSVPVPVGPEPGSEDDHGEVFTKRWVVELILDLCGYSADADLGGLTAVEPACGTGAFLVPMVERLVDSALAFDRSLSDCDEAIRATDLLARNVAGSREAVASVLIAKGIDGSTASALSESWVNQADFLLSPPLPGTAHFVVGNPPYVRLEAIPAARSTAYRQACVTMGGRADLYIGFYEKGLRALRNDGSLGFICADRWMRNAYGSRLRELISSGWSTDAVIHMTGVDAFESDVDAYPAVTVFRRTTKSRGTLVVNANPDFGPESSAKISRIAKDGNLQDDSSERFSVARLPRWFSGPGGWPTGSPETLSTVADLEARLPPLEDLSTGTKVGIGVATGADKVFIVDEAPGVEEERLLALATVRDIADGEVNWSGKKLVNPWNAEGLVSLDRWPGLSTYLGGHRDLLKARHTAKSGRWHKTIDRVIEGLTERPKLYIPDFKEAIFPVLDEGGTYPVRMRGGYLRFQAQYLRKIRLPELRDVGSEYARRLADAFERRDRAAATEAALPLYGLERLPD